MSVKVRIPIVMRIMVGSQSELIFSSSTLSELLDKLVEQFPDTRTNLLDDNGNLHRFVNIYVNNEDVRYLNQLDTALSDGDEVSILPAVAGG